MGVLDNTVEVVTSVPLYDTYTLAASTATSSPITMFTDPISSSKARRLTNLTRSQSLPAPQSFLIRAIRVVFGPAMSRADVQAFLEKYILRLIVSEKDMAIGGLDFFPGGAGMHIMSITTATATTLEYANNGIPDPRAVNVFDHPIEIQQGESFRVELEGTTFTSAAALFLRVYLDGDLQRQVN